MSSANSRLIYLSGFALVLTVCVICVIMVLGESRKTGNNCEQSQCDTICCDSTKCDTVMCDQPLGK
jgi:hypothetical protein